MDAPKIRHLLDWQAEADFLQFSSAASAPHMQEK
jgi:hypothetical protein